MAVNLRAPITSVGPVLDDIRTDLELSAAAASALAALPVLCFGLAAFAAPPVARRLGIERTIAIVLTAMAVGLAVRANSSTAALFIGTLMAGAAIALANVLIPAVIKRDFPQRAGSMTGLYVSVMGAAAAVAAAVAVPVGVMTGWGWRASLGIWTLSSVVALAVWVLVVPTSPARVAITVTPPSSLRRDALAWQVTLFTGLQSLGFYSLVAWLPSIYRSHGLTAEKAGVLMSIVVVVGVPIALIVPNLAARSATQRSWTTATTALTALGLAGLMIAPDAGVWVWPILLGIGTGSAFPLALILVVLRSRNAADATRLSAMSQSIGYLLASVGPFALGAIHDMTNGWDVAIGVLLVATVGQLAAGWGAGRAAWVGRCAPSPPASR